MSSMENTIKNRFSPLNLSNGKRLTNRVVVPPMASETADLNGYVTDKTLEHYSTLGESKAGLIFVEYSFVHESGKSEIHQLGISKDEQLAGLNLLAKRIHLSGSMAGIQLTHSGGKTESRFSGLPLYSPSGVVVPVKDKTLEASVEMNIEDIKNWKKWFLEAATRAIKAEFDLIELHAAHGYGLNQWLSPLTKM